MDRGRTFLAAGLVLAVGCTLAGAGGKLSSAPAKTRQVLMLRPAFDAASHGAFCVRARGAERAAWATPGGARERRDASRRGPQDRPARDARSRGGAKGHLLTGPEMALAGVLVIWGSIVIAGRLRRWAARSR